MESGDLRERGGALAVAVTGGSSGINLAVAKHFCVHGFQVAICGRSAERLRAAEAALGVDSKRYLFAVADVRSESEITAFFTAAAQKFGRLDTVVAGAAGNFVCPAEDMSVNGFKAVVDIDLAGSFITARLALPYLKASRNGCLIFVSAPQASQAWIYNCHVGAAKAGVNQLCRCLAAEWGVHGVRVNGVVPGPTNPPGGYTEGVRRLFSSAGLTRFLETLPLRRCATPAEIANVVAFLASPAASYVTGAIVPVDGGLGAIGSSGFNYAMAEMPPENPFRA